MQKFLEGTVSASIASLSVFTENKQVQSKNAIDRSSNDTSGGKTDDTAVSGKVDKVSNSSENQSTTVVAISSKGLEEIIGPLVAAIGEAVNYFGIRLSAYQIDPLITNMSLKDLLRVPY